jgi:hypothetical protein
MKAALLVLLTASAVLAYEPLAQDTGAAGTWQKQRRDLQAARLPGRHAC